MSAPQINLLDGSFYAADPYPTYRWLRENAPLYRDEDRKIWGVSRYRDIVAIEKNAHLYSSAQGSRPRIPGDTSMINRDDPRHNTQRRLISPRFTPRAVSKHEHLIRSHVTELIDAMLERGSADVVTDLAAPLPAMMINQLLGFPHEMWPKSLWWSEATMLAGGQHGPDGTMNFGATEGGPEAVAEFAQEVMALAALRRSDPQDDLISVWCHAKVDGEPMTDADILSEALLVLDGGAETTRSVIATTALDLIRHDDQRRLLAQDPSRMKVAVEEFIRWVTPILNMRRTVVRDHELHGENLREGDELLLMYASANRDEEVFSDADRYDVTRTPNHHIAFGFGTHFCLGASLARLELRICFEELLTRIPEMQLSGDEPVFVPSVFTRAPAAVNIEFEAAR